MGGTNQGQGAVRGAMQMEVLPSEAKTSIELRESVSAQIETLCPGKIQNSLVRGWLHWQT